MLSRVRDQLPTYGSGFSNWGMLLLDLALPFHEAVVTGPEAASIARDLRGRYLPDAVLAGGEAGGTIPLLEGRHQPGRTLIHVCRDRTCGLPVRTVAEALAQLGAGVGER
jgi:uncharacterized protein YyaL (SSP411 family)